MKKLILINFLILILVGAGFLASEYFMTYPAKFNIGKFFQQISFTPGILFIIASAVFSLPFSFLRMKRLNFREKYLRVFPVMNLILIVLIIKVSYPIYAETKTRIEGMQQQYIIKAKNDIRNDLIIYEYAGGITDTYNEKLAQQTDSITKKYGIVYQNTGCIIDNESIEARKKYTEITEAYLIQRNGKGWETKMDAEINSLKKKN
ncbi:hypothetical protein [Elizabethkingia anophelis]|uniref:FEKKY domain-containing protein n=1 Tax=Elizabethkingia anophelis TaxID=1117645 RepID=UPI0004CE292F|nr:hypothetical protein [Elizabethkingia anophelis]MCT3699080.1 hypothetical protein [Elizabethkingia anophelis]MCT3924944.1 hypothetical protein [Elizabethkingia anophelis]MCT3958766.1 hypothetical protein [Elizabethkingia anophelis]MCT4060511.1 hypothetical protein [Elizabethkingia anophelis]MCT4106803.1 hypothetical protein [Elizabethkingia anophelis]